MPNYSQGELLLALLVFPDAQGGKKRPGLVVYDFGDSDLLVVPITSHPARVQADIAIDQWGTAELKLPSCVRTEKLATIQKSLITKKSGVLRAEGMAAVRAALVAVFDQIVA